jgi:hypothetical protein
MGVGSIVILTSLGWLLVFWLMGKLGYGRDYHKGYFNGWHDHNHGQTYDSKVKK